ncbi:RraA family protein [Paracandidimonas soli]|uniref:RraA family protein n=1 Tax=Paracandidimonas soli TaxID=1917182 RepID=UPI00334092EF
MSSFPNDRRWKKPLTPFVFNRDIDRPSPADVATLAQADVTQISDLVGRMYVCQPHLRSLVSPAVPLCGPAFTVKCPPGDNLGVMAAFRAIERGDVLVVDGQGFTHWCMGGFELLKYACELRGMAGLVVHGAWRDVAEAQAAGFPVYGLAVSPYSGPKFGPAELNVPVGCAGVIIQPGDVVCASTEGVAVVPRGSVPQVAQAVRERKAGHGIEHFLDEMDEHVAAWLEDGK